MKIYSRPDQTVLAESAHSGELADFPDISRGWGKSLDLTGGIPPMEWFNALGKRTDEAIRYLSQRGISEWSASESYPQGAVSYFNQQLWFALSDNQNSQPQQGAIWQRISFTEQQIKQLISVNSVNGKTGDVNLTPADLGLGNAALRNVGGEPGELLTPGVRIPSRGQPIRFGSDNIAPLEGAGAYLTTSLEVTNLGSPDAPAVMLFHRDGHYAYYFGMDKDTSLSIGGFSLGNNRYRIYHENFKPQAKDVGALANTGGEVTGNITISNPSYDPSLQIKSAIFNREARFYSDGNITGSAWNGSNLYDYLQKMRPVMGSGWWRCPSSGFIIQWFSGPMAERENEQYPVLNYPIAFPNRCFVAMVSTINTRDDVYPDQIFQVSKWDSTSIKLFPQWFGTGWQSHVYPVVLAVGY